MSTNKIITDNWSNDKSRIIYENVWKSEPDINNKYENGFQCGGCSFYAKFNFDFGLCCNGRSRHYLETVFEHFTCPSHIEEGWGSHSFTQEKLDFEKQSE